MAFATTEVVTNNTWVQVGIATGAVVIQPKHDTCLLQFKATQPSDSVGIVLYPSLLPFILENCQEKAWIKSGRTDKVVAVTVTATS